MDNAAFHVIVGDAGDDLTTTLITYWWVGPVVLILSMGLFEAARMKYQFWCDKKRLQRLKERNAALTAGCRMDRRLCAAARTSLRRDPPCSATSSTVPPQASSRVPTPPASTAVEGSSTEPATLSSTLRPSITTTTTTSPWNSPETTTMKEYGGSTPSLNASRPTAIANASASSPTPLEDAMVIASNSLSTTPRRQSGEGSATSRRSANDDSVRTSPLIPESRSTPTTTTSEGGVVSGFASRLRGLRGVNSTPASSSAVGDEVGGSTSGRPSQPALNCFPRNSEEEWKLVEKRRQENQEALMEARRGMASCSKPLLKPPSDL